jgi:DNA polymerase-4
VVVRQADAVAGRLRAHGLEARTIVLKLRYGDFTTITRSATLAEPVRAGPDVAEAAGKLLAAVDVAPGVRLLGVAATGLARRGPRQLSLAVQDLVPWDEASQAIDGIRERFGEDAIGPATSLGPRGLRAVRRGQQAWGPDRAGGDDQRG